MAAQIASALKTSYEGDEVALGLALAIAIHAIPIILLLVSIFIPSHDAPDQELVAKPVIAASLLKLGKPLDPKKLPDRIAPKQSTTNAKTPVASQNDPVHTSDAGTPPPDAKQTDLQQLMAKSDPFAEDAGKVRPDEGFANGSDAGTETDPSKVHAGDLYATALDAFFRQRWNIPSVISQGDENKLCVQYQVNISPRMVIWHLQESPTKKSGNDLYDDSAKETLQKLLDDKTPLPDPPKEIAEQYRGRTVVVGLGKGCK